MSRSSSPSPPPPAEAPAPVALIPAAGRATRLGGPGGPEGSKEILPVGPSRRPVARFLLDGLARAGVDRAYVMIRPAKWDVPRRLGDGGDSGVRIAYVTVPETRSICETLDRAHPFVRDRPVVLGFPDILFRPPDAFARIAERWREGGVDAVLALVPTDRPHKADVVRTDPSRRVVGIEIKPPIRPGGGTDPAAPYLTWIGAVWGPAVTGILHEMVAAERQRPAGGPELYPSHVLLEGLRRGLRV
ncbi:MAG: NTP transferase domain-containing protein, partial [Acidobacteriota bacterium]